jgi:hypothetical protein
LLGLSPKRDVRTYMRAAAEVEEVFEVDKLHPGALHYLIHAYDDPMHAPLGLRAARLYAKVAPGASHAQHMISHIFIALGLWDEAIKANEASVRVAEAQGEHAVALRWGASRGAVAYDVQRGSAPLATVRGTRTLDEGLGVGGTYCYTVRALDGAGSPSDPVGPACATTPDLTPPTAPADVIAAPDGENAVTLR